jgi:hypothetical protein
MMEKPDVHKGEIPEYMTEQKGHFEQGRWVVESEPLVTQPDENVIDKRFSEATKSVISSVDNVMKVTRDLVATEEGKQFIEKTIKDTQTQIQRSFDEIIGRLKNELDKKVKNLK